MSNQIIEEFSASSFFKNLGKSINKAVIQPINKTVIKPAIPAINNTIIKPAITAINNDVIKPIEKVVDDVKKKVEEAVDPGEPEPVTYDETKPSDLYNPPPAVYRGPGIEKPQFNSVKLTAVKFETDDVVDGINDPTIPSNKENTSININRYNTKTIEYLDTDIYYKSNNEKYTIKDKLPTTNKYIKYFIIAIFLVLGILIFIEFSKSPKERWNILVIYVLLVIFIKFFYNINKRFLFFNRIDGIDKIFSKNKKLKFPKFLRLRR